MSYYFPVGGTEAITTQSITFALTATSASAAQFTTIPVVTASYAVSVELTPPNGTNGTNKSANDCTGTAPIGPKGVQGPTGSSGIDNNTCPAGTIECVGLNVSLSGAFPGYPYGINHTLPSGSRYSKVCMEIPPGCDLINVGCPGSLPIAYPNIP